MGLGMLPQHTVDQVKRNLWWRRPRSGLWATASRCGCAALPACRRLCLAGRPLPLGRLQVTQRLCAHSAASLLKHMKHLPWELTVQYEQRQQQRLLEAQVHVQAPTLVPPGPRSSVSSSDGASAMRSAGPASVMVREFSWSSTPSSDRFFDTCARIQHKHDVQRKSEAQQPSS